MASATHTHIPPQNLEAEESVLGAMMVSEAAITPVILDVRLHDEDFYRDRHRVVFGAIKALYERSEPIDALTVSELLSQRGELEAAGGKDTVSTLASTVPAPGNARHYAQIVKQNALLRRLLTAAQTIQQSVHEREGEPEELVEGAERLLFKVAHEERASDFRQVAEVLAEEIDRLEQLSKGDTELTGTPSGFKDLDDKTGGFQPGNLIVVAARPSMGKSAMVCNIADHVAVKHGRPVAFFSLEMSETELAHRFIASRARIAADRLRKGKVTREWERVLRASNELEHAPLWIDDSSDLGLLDLRAKTRRLQASSGGLGLVIVDYIQLMRADDPRQNRVEQVGHMSRGLKILARELDVPVIGLSQLSRAPEQRHPQVPILSDLRESGCLTGETPIYLPDKGTYVSISELVGRPGVNVLALDEESSKLEPRRVERAFSTGRKPVLRLGTALGRSVRATANHRFLTIDGWRRLDEIEVGDHVALPRTLPGPSGSEMTDGELALLGHLIGDGRTLPTHAIQYTSKERSLARLVADLAIDVFGDRIRPRINAERRCFQVYLSASKPLSRGSRNPVAEWLRSLGAFGLRSHQKRVPAAVFAESPHGVATFLRHLWATDGCVWLGGHNGKKQPIVYYATSSPGLAWDVQSLLLRLGINATVGSPSGQLGRIQHHVRVSGASDIGRFLDRVSALGEARERHQSAILAWLDSRSPNTNRDLIPKQVWTEIVEPAPEEVGISTRAMQAELGNAYCGTTLHKSDMSRERAQRVAEIVDSQPLRTLATSDVFWDRVVSVREDGHERVYDLTVEGLHNFVAANVVVHNSIEQDADLVAFIYREEYYQRAESERPGEADLIIAKHRNGPTGTVELAFLEHYPSFANLSRQQKPVEQQPGEELPDLATAEEG